MTIQRVLSKKAKTDALLADRKLKDHVPLTRTMDRETLREMLHKYGMIYVKPVGGTFGRGVIRVEYSPGSPDVYQFQSEENKFRFHDFDSMYDSLLIVKRKTSYLAQQGIELLKYRKRRFDLRVMVQRNPKGHWETTGIIGRLAHPRKIVTNYHSGGTPMAIEILIAEHLRGHTTISAYRQKLGSLGVEVARALERRFPRIQEIGVDVAVDQNLKPWILEVNTLPDPFIFRKLKDRSAFRRIYRYAVAYGRFRKRLSRRS
ncbi:YheC/YheD family protein [Cohnella thailandensis]|uniref:YheC/YheD family protein n=1 Tax=Cohnella thailandensis TaxID=557557 RepID=A0A841SSS6_9BACL|nr:YheC/YheD family protein [Cohnella thailandensis]MBB6634029.1 YheC/YheD family protein [Cohnella thailandensis]MBP1972478.1 hypothetical protein [Cohnella thailandensis]